MPGDLLGAAIQVPEGEGRPAIDLVCEVEQHLGDDRVRAVAMDATDGLRRGDEIADTGGPITVPVGRETLGRIFNLLGDPIDEGEPVKGEERWPIHRHAPDVEDLVPTQEILETGIKVIDLLAPYAKGGKVGLFGGAGRRQDGADPGADSQRSPRSTRASRPSAAWASAPARATTSGWR